MNIKSLNWWCRPPTFSPSYEVKLEHTMGRVDVDEIIEIFAWLRENISNEWSDRSFANENYLVGITFFFNNEVDAIAFKMRWIK